MKRINIVHSVTKNVLNMANSASSADPSCSVFCSFALLLYVPVNSYGHYGMVSSSNHTFSWVNLIKRLTSTSCTYKKSLVTTTHLEWFSRREEITTEIISWPIFMKVWDRTRIELVTPGSAVRQASVARHVTDCAKYVTQLCSVSSGFMLFV